jgi:hypothetical protein
MNLEGIGLLEQEINGVIVAFCDTASVVISDKIVYEIQILQQEYTDRRIGEYHAHWLLM